MKLNTHKNGSSQKDEVEMVISQIRELIITRQLEPGDKLPSERSLSQKFGVSRNQLRLAIQKLEFYGLVQKFAKSGTFVSRIGVDAINVMISNILHLQTPDFKSLVETRIILETKAIKLAAIRRTEKQNKVSTSYFQLFQFSRKIVLMYPEAPFIVHHLLILTRRP